MLTENGIAIDMEAVLETLRRADVLTVAFSLFPERLLIDVRANDRQGPFAGIVEPVSTVQERYQWLGRHRGAFGAPEAFSFFLWPHTIRWLVERHALGPMQRRLEAADGDGAAQFDAALQQLVTMERDATRAAVRGDDPWKALWRRE